MATPQVSERSIRLQSRGEKGVRPRPSDPLEGRRQLLRGALMVGKEDPLPQDHLFPTLWSATAYDSFKYSGLRKAALDLLSKVVEGGTRAAMLPLHVSLALARRAGAPVDEISKSPEQLQAIVNLMTQNQPQRGRFKGASMTSKDEFLQEHLAELLATEDKARRESVESFRKAASLTAGLAGAALGGALASAPKLMDKYREHRFNSAVRGAVGDGPLASAIHAVKGVGGAISDIKDMATSDQTQEFLGKAKKFVGDHPVGTALGVAGLGAAAAGLHGFHQRGMQSGRHQQSYQQALELFPELRQEDPRKMELLFSSAAHVAPTMATNPLLLGTWMKGLARGYQGTHLGTEDLKRLQDLEVQHTGGAAKPEGMLSKAKNVVGIGGGLAALMSSMNRGQGVGK